MQIVPRLPDSEILSERFCQVIRAWLSSDEIAEINRRNATADYQGCCASHDFCDANAAMIDALGTFGITFEVANPTVVEIVDAAWAAASQRKFQEISAQCPTM